MVRSNDGEAQEALEGFASRVGFYRVGFVGFWWAVLTAKSKKRLAKINKANSQPPARK